MPTNKMHLFLHRGNEEKKIFPESSPNVDHRNLGKRGYSSASLTVSFQTLQHKPNPLTVTAADS